MTPRPPTPEEWLARTREPARWHPSGRDFRLKPQLDPADVAFSATRRRRIGNVALVGFVVAAVIAIVAVVPSWRAGLRSASERPASALSHEWMGGPLTADGQLDLPLGAGPAAYWDEDRSTVSLVRFAPFCDQTVSSIAREGSGLVVRFDSAEETTCDHLGRVTTLVISTTGVATEGVSSLDFDAPDGTRRHVPIDERVTVIPRCAADAVALSTQTVHAAGQFVDLAITNRGAQRCVVVGAPTITIGSVSVAPPVTDAPSGASPGGRVTALGTGDTVHAQLHLANATIDCAGEPLHVELPGATTDAEELTDAGHGYCAAQWADNWVSVFGAARTIDTAPEATVSTGAFIADDAERARVLSGDPLVLVGDDERRIAVAVAGDSCAAPTLDAWWRDGDDLALRLSTSPQPSCASGADVSIAYLDLPFALPDSARVRVELGGGPALEATVRRGIHVAG